VVTTEESSSFWSRFHLTVPTPPVTWRGIRAWVTTSHMYVKQLFISRWVWFGHCRRQHSPARFHIACALRMCLEWYIWRRCRRVVESYSNVWFCASRNHSVWYIVPSDKLIKKGDSRVQLRYVESSSSSRS